MEEYKIPIIDVQNLLSFSEETVLKEVRKIRNACSENGFFYVANHGVDIEKINKLVGLSHQFFTLPLEEKNNISMEKGGLAWRGFFSVGEELTAGLPDKKEGLYFGKELDDDHEKVKSKTPMHGKNLFPNIDGFDKLVLAYMAELETLGQILLQGIALSLDLEKDFFYKKYTWDPLVLFRIFHYPSILQEDKHIWSVGEHTDYGLLTILLQDNIGGLQIKTQGKWIDAPPIENTFVCNIGDILDIVTHGKYKSTPHRVINKSGKSRLSMPFFMDPNFDADIDSLYDTSISMAEHERWDKANIYDYKGKYGDYVLNKVSKVFPQLISSK